MQDLEAQHGSTFDEPWGRWVRQIELEPEPGRGQVLMTGTGGAPLLIVERIGDGRVALLASDHAWLWSRGFEGGGPQLELLRRVAHWSMKEPDLEEEALIATAEGQTVSVMRRTLGDAVGAVTVTAPDGSEFDIELTEDIPGQHSAFFEGPEIGLYRLVEGDHTTVVALGPSAPREFEQTVATGSILDPVAASTRGGVLPLFDGTPDIRRVREGRVAVGRGWIGITPREAYVTEDVRVVPLLSAWVFLLLAAGLAIGAWLFEGRRTGSRAGQST